MISFMILFKITPIKFAIRKILKYFLSFIRMATHSIPVMINNADPKDVINFIIVVSSVVGQNVDIIN